MAVTAVVIDAAWDPDAQVWVATSEDVPGLATEAPTTEELVEKLRVMVPELLEENGLVEKGRGRPAVTIDLHAHRREVA